MRAIVCLCLAFAAAPVLATEVRLTAGDLVPFGPGLWMAAGLKIPAPDNIQPIVGQRVDKDAALQLTRLANRGVAQGFADFIYDNRDRGHSVLGADRFPRLMRLSYGPDLVEAGTDYGLAGTLLFPAVVFGNSSTAVTGGDVPRSLPRLAMTFEARPPQMARLYRNNALYVYPEHRDHDAADRFPANWPYTVISQGSSSSDRAFLEAIAATLAAFPPETFGALAASRRMAPTLQLILRRNLEGVNRTEEYFSGAAHPVVIEGRRIRMGRMVAHAAAMTPETIPPVVRLDVIDESFRAEAGLAGLSERLFDTAQAVARLWRSPMGVHEMVVSAARSVDSEGRDLTFRWVLLQGDPTRVEIEPLDEAGQTARLRFFWQDPWEVPAAVEPDGIEGDVPTTRQLSRIDIAVFAEAPGTGPSAPAFVTVDLPEHQIRSYEPGPDGLPRLRSIDYDAAARGASFDPLLYWSAPWSDEPLFDESGRLTAWRRTHAIGEVTEVPRGTSYGATGSQALPILKRQEALSD